MNYVNIRMHGVTIKKKLSRTLCLQAKKLHVLNIVLGTWKKRKGYRNTTEQFLQNCHVFTFKRTSLSRAAVSNRTIGLITHFRHFRLPLNISQKLNVILACYVGNSVTAVA
jgi:hypothetical protein